MERNILKVRGRKNKEGICTMRIGVVIVTRNRFECLKKTLGLYDIQTKRPEYIVVVNNCSTDSVTADYLDKWKLEKSDYKRIVVHSTENGGGSGGFYLAEQEAIKHDADWIWHADDDAYPDKNALKEIEMAYLKDNLNVVAYSASVKNVDHPDEDVSYWMKLHKGFFITKWLPITTVNDCFEVDKFMYLGCVIKKDILLQAGFTNKDFFIHEDDIEHSMRIKKYGRIIAVKKSILFHPTWKDVQNPDEINWKYYYSIRNKISSIGMNLGYRFLLGEVFKAEVKHFVHILKRYPRRVLLMEKEAIQDGKNGKLGKNENYLP